MKYKYSKFLLLFLLVLLINSCISQQSTIYSRIPKQIKKQIEKNYDNSNAFFYQSIFNSDTFLFWYYRQSTVIWFSFIKGKLHNKGTFVSDNGASGYSIYKTNSLLKAELNKLEENCFAALDGELFGYVIEVPSETFLFSELVVLTYISSTECFINSKTDNFFLNDFKKIRDLNYQIKTIDAKR